MDCLQSLQEIYSLMSTCNKENNRYTHYNRLLYRIQGLQSLLITLSYQSRDANKKYTIVIKELSSSLKGLLINHRELTSIKNSSELPILKSSIKSFADISCQVLEIFGVLMNDTIDVDETSMCDEDASDIKTFLSCFDIYGNLSKEDMKEFISTSLISFGHSHFNKSFRTDIESYPIPRTFSDQISRDCSLKVDSISQSLGSSKPSIDSYRVEITDPTIYRNQSMTDTCGSTVSSISQQSFIPRLKLPVSPLCKLVICIFS